MSIRYDLPRGQFFDEEGRYVNPATVAEKLRQAESEAVKWKARQRSTEQKLGYEEKLRGQAEAEAREWRERKDIIDVRPDGRYLTNVNPVTLNVVEDGWVEHRTLNLGEFVVRHQAM